MLATTMACYDKCCSEIGVCSVAWWTMPLVLDYDSAPYLLEGESVYMELIHIVNVTKKEPWLVVHDTSLLFDMLCLIYISKS